MADRIENASGEGKEIPSQNVDGRSLVGLLLYVFFGHQPEYADIAAARRTEAKTGGQPRRQAGQVKREEAKEKLIQILDKLHAAVASGKFDASGHSWITPNIISSYFGKGRKAYYLRPKIKSEDLPVGNSHASKFPTLFAVLCEVAMDVFSEEESVLPYIKDLREIIGFEGDCEGPQQVLRRIVSSLREQSNSHFLPIKYDVKGQPIFRAGDDSAFGVLTSQVGRYEKAIAGRYKVYRRVFAAALGRDYVCEYLEISKEQRGLHIRWETRGKDVNDVVEFLGVCFLIKGGFWLMTHCADPYPRVRMLAASIKDWTEHEESLETAAFCRGYITSHVQSSGVLEPRSGLVICRRDEGASNQSPEDRVRFFTRDQLEGEPGFSPDLISQLDCSVVPRLISLSSGEQVKKRGCPIEESSAGAAGSVKGG